MLLIAAALACLPGHRLVDWSDRLPGGTWTAEFVISVTPAYTRLLVYPPGHPEAMERCCGGRLLSVVRVPVTDGRFCVGQSQGQMSWKLHLSLRPDLQL
jgi:hypothetical protein